MLELESEDPSYSDGSFASSCFDMPNMSDFEEEGPEENEEEALDGYDSDSNNSLLFLLEEGAAEPEA